MTCKDCGHKEIIHWRVKVSKRACHFEDCVCQKFVLQDNDGGG